MITSAMKEKVTRSERWEPEKILPKGGGRRTSHGQEKGRFRGERERRENAVTRLGDFLVSTVLVARVFVAGCSL